MNIRSPDATRPWQHVGANFWLSPLGSSLASGDRLNGMSFNFGPKSEQSKTVVELASASYTLKAYVADLPAAHI